MKAVRTFTHQTLRAAVRQLALTDPMLAGIVERWGAPPMWGRQPGFTTLVRIILEQQVSLAAAATLYKRLVAHAGTLTPHAVMALGAQGLREFGLTRQKSAYCHGLATRIIERSLDLALVSRTPDAAGRAMLLAVPGLGPWSVDIYYLMALRRPDFRCANSADNPTKPTANSNTISSCSAMSRAFFARKVRVPPSMRMVRGVSAS